MSPGHQTAASRFNAVGVAAKEGCRYLAQEPNVLTVDVTVPAEGLQNIPAGTSGERHN